MARRRLTPPNPDLIPEDTVSAGTETKSPFLSGSARPPIAQVAGEASALSALDEMTAEIARARAEGRIVQKIALSDIAADHLVRDRMVCDDEEMAVLVSSIRARGQQTPVEVLDRGEGALPRYGLISGWRRLSALREIGAGAALVIVRTPRSAADAYVSMVEENEIRADISFYERARIVTKALEQGVYDDAKSALQGLFGNVSRAKRSKIKSFMAIVAALDHVLRFPAAISEKLGLDLVRRLEADPSLAGQLAERLNRQAPATAAEETSILIARDASGAVAEPEREEVDFRVGWDPGKREILISGVGVDDGLMRDLRRWLSRRQRAGTGDQG